MVVPRQERSALGRGEEDGENRKQEDRKTCRHGDAEKEMKINDDHLKTIRAHRIPALNLPNDFIVPNYGGRSIVNVPASIAKIFGEAIQRIHKETSVSSLFE